MSLKRNNLFIQSSPDDPSSYCAATLGKNEYATVKDELICEYPEKRDGYAVSILFC
jgi:hypothetical protein